MKRRFSLWAMIMLIMLIVSAQPAFAAKSPPIKRPISKRAPIAQPVVVYQFHTDT